MWELLSIRRPIVAGDHYNFRNNINRINHEHPDLQIKWRRLGEAGVSLLERGEYDRVTRNGSGNLSNADPQRIAITLNDTIIPKNAN